MDNVIQQLKDNEKPFGLMSAEMQATAKDISIVKFDYYCGQNDGDWDTESKDDMFRFYRTYRLCDTYADEPEIVECEIYRSRHGNFYIDVYDFEDDREVGLNTIPVGYKRIGFLFADGIVKGSPVKYSVPGITSHGYYASHEDLKTKQALEHHAISVLFRRKKQE